MITLWNVALALLLWMFPSGGKDFSGAWKLDKAKSVNLPPSFAQVESYTMNIRQTADSMIVVASLEGSGQHVTFPAASYVLNGTEVFREDTLRQSKRWTKCSWASGGKTLVLTSRVEQGSGEKKKAYSQRDEWKLLDASSLEITVTQKYAHPDSTRVEHRFYRKTK